MRPTDAKSIANRLQKVADDIDKSLTDDGQLTKAKALAIKKRLLTIAQKVTEINEKNSMSTGNMNGKQYAMHTEAKTLEKQLLAVVGGFQKLADSGRRKISRKRSE